MAAVRVGKIAAGAHRLVITKKGAAAGEHTASPSKVEGHPLIGLYVRSGSAETVHLLTRGETRSGDEILQLLADDGVMYIVFFILPFRYVIVWIPSCQTGGELWDDKTRT